MTELDPWIAGWCERAEAFAWADNVTAMAEDPANPLKAAVGAIGTVRLPVVGALGFSLFDRVIGLGVDEPATDADLDAIHRFYADHAGGEWAVSLAPGVMPADLPDRLVARGYRRGQAPWPKVWRETAQPPTVPTDLRIEEVGRAGGVADFTRVNIAAWGVPEAFAPWFGASFGRPGWHHYLGYDGSDAVAAGAMLVVDDVAWLGFGATVPEHRGRGGQSAIFARRIRDAGALGCRIAVTETGPDTREVPNPSYHNMIRAGFTLAYLRPNFVRGLVAAG